MPRPYFASKKQRLEEIIRVDQAGEFGARCIYAGQLAATKNSEAQPILQHMFEQEKEHLDYFNNKLIEHQMRPTILLPLWHAVGYLSGFISAKFGSRAAMLLTESVEDVIEQHYQQQITHLREHHHEHSLIEALEKFQQDEIDHKNIAIEHHSQTVPGAKHFSQVVKLFCRGAIIISKKI